MCLLRRVVHYDYKPDERGERDGGAERGERWRGKERGIEIDVDVIHVVCCFLL